MRPLKLLILVSTVTLLSACGGKKNSRPNVLQPKTPSIEKTQTGDFRLNGTDQCELTDAEMNKKEVCTVLRDKINADSPCTTELIIIFKAEKCEVEVPSQIIEEKLAGTEISEDGKSATVFQNHDMKVDTSEARLVFDNPTITSTTNTTTTTYDSGVINQEQSDANDEKYAHLSRDSERSSPTTVAQDVKTYENSDAFMVINKPLPEYTEENPVTEKVVIPADVVEVEIPVVAETEESTEPNIRFFPEISEEEAIEKENVVIAETAAQTTVETSTEPNIRFFPELAEKAQVIQSTPQTFDIVTEESKAGTVTRVEKKRGDKFEATVLVDANQSPEEKAAFACMAAYKDQCAKEFRSEVRANRCFKKISKRTFRQCEKSTLRKMNSN